MSGKTTKQPELEFVAFVDIDWADQKHVWCLQAAGSTQRELGELQCCLASTIDFRSA